MEPIDAVPHPHLRSFLPRHLRRGLVGALERSGAMLLLVASWVFYGAWDWRFVPLLIASALMNWGAAASGRTQRRSASARRRLVLGGVALNLEVLGFFKSLRLLRRPGAPQPDGAMAGYRQDPALMQVILRSACRSSLSRGSATWSTCPKRRVPPASLLEHPAADDLLPAPRLPGDRARRRRPRPAAPVKRPASTAAWSLDGPAADRMGAVQEGRDRFRAAPPNSWIRYSPPRAARGGVVSRR